MELITERRGDVLLIRIATAALDLATSGDFRESVTPLIEHERKVIFDLTDIGFIDSSGLGIFISCMRKLQGRGGDLKMCGMSSTVRMVFELVRMHKVVDICNDRDEAVRRFA